MTETRKWWIRTLSGFAGAFALVFSWDAVYPHAAVWQLVIAGVLGSLAAGQSASSYLKARAKDRGHA